MNREDRNGIDDISMLLGEMKSQIATMAGEVTALRKEMTELRGIRDQGKGWLGAITFAAAIIGSIITGLVSHFWQSSH